MWMDKSPNVNMFLPTKDSLTAATVELKAVNEKVTGLNARNHGFIFLELI
jgi:hypothetical protein